ncbi:flagellar biosynthetic protein FliR [Methylococcus sp. EFPC2]|uniref:flagellar biosynthetic protein FliR n=1 Tax=Methylococcus sp. EFPC2 TaxID=2812648 RepID=UPI0019671080|nr:flagellar biosynthetic protein FliR [Methylococcus sp. EFPC2]QSA97638.1 flagellar biosynthetic protein FliR [Methylococcus sp. EFPC2]
MRFSEAELLELVARFVWPLARIGGLLVAMPILTGNAVPPRVLGLLALGVTVALMPALPPMPAVPLFSLGGFLITLEQVLIGALFGLILHFVFAAIVFGGQNVAYNMGLGFASLIDPQTGVQVPVIAQFYLILATLFFLGVDGHLLVIQLVADSFRAIPVDLGGLSRDRLWGVIVWSGRLFAAGVLMSLPLVAALLLVNLGFGVASRSAPQLNIFSVGFPVSLLLGLLMVSISLPDVMALFGDFLDEGYRIMSQMMN